MNDNAAVGSGLRRHHAERNHQGLRNKRIDAERVNDSEARSAPALPIVQNPFSPPYGTLTYALSLVRSGYNFGSHGFPN